MNSLRLYRYRLPLIVPIQSGNQRLTFREGLLLRQTIDDRDAWAEAAPLPGHSVETLSEVIKAARQGDWDACASLQFAHASLALGPTQGWVSVNALLMGEMAELKRSLRRVAQSPHVAVKLKVARGGPLDEEIALVRALQRSLRPDQRLRLDANRGWNYNEAVEFCKAVVDGGVEYLEEPTHDPADFERLTRASGLPYALDETLREPIELDDFPHAAALIIKPTLLGGPEQLTALVTSSVPCVFSAAFESGVGIVNIARLARQYPHSAPMGLDTYRWLTDDVLRPRLSMAGGTFDGATAWTIDFSRLDELPL